MHLKFVFKVFQGSIVYKTCPFNGNRTSNKKKHRFISLFLAVQEASIKSNGSKKTEILLVIWNPDLSAFNFHWTLLALYFYSNCKANITNKSWKCMSTA